MKAKPSLWRKVVDKEGNAKVIIDPHPGQKRILTNDRRFQVMLAGSGGGKCIPEDVRVLLSDGRRLPIRDVNINDEVVVLDDNLKTRTSKVKHKINSGKLIVYQLKTTLGRELKVSETHPLLTIDGWKPITNLKEGEYIGVPRAYPTLGTKRYAPNLLKILGYLLGDGGLTNLHHITFTSASNEILDDFQRCLPNPCKIKYKEQYDYNVNGYGKNRPNPILNFIRGVGLSGCNSYTKHIPAFVFELVNEDIALVINRLFACDGWVEVKGVGYCSVSKQLIYEVQHLLLRFGILSRIRYRKVKFQNGISFAYELSIFKAPDIIKFRDKIGIFSKDDKLNKLILSKENERWQPQDLIPINLDFLYKRIQKDGQNHLKYKRDIPRYNALRGCRHDNVERNNLQELVKWFNDTKLQQLAYSDVFWDTIKEISILGEEQCYDLEIENYHNFVAEDIFAHNTRLLSVWMYLEILRCGTGDYLAVSPTIPLQNLQLIPTFIDFFETTLGIGQFKAAKRQLIINTKSADGEEIKATIFFGSAKNPESLESAVANAACLDEAGQDKFKLSAWEAILRRVGHREGRVLIATTLYNYGWLKRELYDKWEAGDPDINIVQFDSIENPYYSRDEYENARKRLPAWKFDMQYRGIYRRPAGLIFSDFDENRHVIEPFPIPSSWSWHVGIDPGAVHTALVWVAEDPTTKKFYITRSYLDGNKTTKEHVQKAMRFHEYNRVTRWVGGAGNEQQFRDDWKAEGIHVREPEIRDVESGIDRVTALLRENRLFIFDTEENEPLIEEFRSYSRELDDKNEPTDRIQNKGEYHILDGLRYVACGLSPQFNSERLLVMSSRRFRGRWRH